MRWEVVIPLILLVALFAEQVIWWNKIIRDDQPRRAPHDRQPNTDGERR